MTKVKNSNLSLQATLRRLRHKFVIVTMLLITVVVGIAFVSIMVVNNARVENEVNSTLSKATMEANPLSSSPSLDDGQLTFDPVNQRIIFSPDNAGDSGETDEDSQDGGIGTDTGMGDGESDLDTVTMSNGRMLALTICKLDADGNITIVKDELGLGAGGAAAAVDAVELTDTATRGLTITGKTVSSDLIFMARMTADGWNVAFCSTDYMRASNFALARMLSMIGLATIAAMLIVVIALSYWIVRPTERAWQQQQQFVADASHELKTPLAVITANNSIIKAHPQSSVESQMQWVVSTEEEASLMRELVEDMLFLAKSSETRKAQEAFEHIDLSDMVENVCLQFESIAFENGLEIDSEVCEGVSVEGVPTRLKRVVAVLLDNACKYAGEGGRVQVRLEKAGNSARLCVNNTGEPIPASDLPHVFDRFYRADKARVREKGGFGLGLAIAHEIVEDHGGSISVVSTQAQGTTFTVSLKLKS